MINIISVGEINTRYKVRFRCPWCGCIFDADKADYTDRTVEECHINMMGKEVWEKRYQYHANCPICGVSVWINEDDADYWAYTTYEDGTEHAERVR